MEEEMQRIWAISIKQKKSGNKVTQAEHTQTHTHTNQNVVINKSFPQCKGLVESVSYVPPQ